MNTQTDVNEGIPHTPTSNHTMTFNGWRWTDAVLKAHKAIAGLPPHGATAKRNMQLAVTMGSFLTFKHSLAK